MLKNIFGDSNKKELKKITNILNTINNINFANLTDGNIKNKIVEFRGRYKNGESLDDLLPEAYALVREASYRVLCMKHFDVQIMGGIALHHGKIAEMKTGEGKTLIATLPAYLNAITGEPVHIVTVNDYLAKRDSETMRPLYEALGLTVACITHEDNIIERKTAYNCDITYVTNNELGFDYLKDNMVNNKENLVQRGLSYAIIDEIDSVLIDEARTPLIISGSGKESSELYVLANDFVQALVRGEVINDDIPVLRKSIDETGDFVYVEKDKAISLTENGVKKAEDFFKVKNLSDATNLYLTHYINNALRANYMMVKDRDYVVKNNEVHIVDEFTGRIMIGRRFSNGLHQAIEAKEQTEIKNEAKTLATITFQSFFNKYKKKSGMTGTAKTEESEFKNIYNLETVVIPTNKPVLRIDYNDVVYLTEKAKYNAVVAKIKELHSIKQPVLVGTVSVEKSEYLSNLLAKENIPHNVLNAKNNELEADIVAKAGEIGSVTIATNMAGRGTDIKLGKGVTEIGGLFIIGTERHESRRVDNQLRGRAGRQGDVGASQFFLSMEDDLLRLFGSDKLKESVSKLNFPEDYPLEMSILSNSIESAQKKIEGNNFAIRETLVKYDQVINTQREIIYEQRKKIILEEDIRNNITSILKASIGSLIDFYVYDELSVEEWNLSALMRKLGAFIPITELKVEKNITKTDFKNNLISYILKYYNSCSDVIGLDNLIITERRILLNVIDQAWINHLDAIDKIKDGIGLQAYANKDPLLEYKFKSFDMFNELNKTIQNDFTQQILHTIKTWKREDIDVLRN